MIRTRSTLLHAWVVVSIGIAGCREDSRIGATNGLDAGGDAASSDADRSGADASAPAGPVVSGRVFAEGPAGIHEMALDGTDLFWIGNDIVNGRATGTSGLWRAPRVGGPPIRLVQRQDDMYALALDEQYVYYASTVGQGSTGGAIWRIARSGGQPQVLVADIGNPTSIAVDETRVYFTNAVSPGGDVRSVAKNGGAVQVVISELDGPSAIDVDGAALYISEGNRGRILRVPKQGGAPVVLAAGWIGTSWLKVRGDLVFFSSCDIGECPVEKLWRVPTTGAGLLLVHEGPIRAGGQIALARGVALWGSWLLADGADPVRLSLTSDQEGPTAVALDESAAYVAEFFSGRILTMPLDPNGRPALPVQDH